MATTTTTNGTYQGVLATLFGGFRNTKATPTIENAIKTAALILLGKLNGGDALDNMKSSVLMVAYDFLKMPSKYRTKQALIDMIKATAMTIGDPIDMINTMIRGGYVVLTDHSIPDAAWQQLTLYWTGGNKNAIIKVATGEIDIDALLATVNGNVEDEAPIEDEDEEDEDVDIFTNIQPPTHPIRPIMPVPAMPIPPRPIRRGNEPPQAMSTNVKLGEKGKKMVAAARTNKGDRCNAMIAVKVFNLNSHVFCGSTSKTAANNGWQFCCRCSTTAMDGSKFCAGHQKANYIREIEDYEKDLDMLPGGVLIRPSLPCVGDEYWMPPNDLLFGQEKVTREAIQKAVKDARENGQLDALKAAKFVKHGTHGPTWHGMGNKSLRVATTYSIGKTKKSAATTTAPTMDIAKVFGAMSNDQKAEMMKQLMAVLNTSTA